MELGCVLCQCNLSLHSTIFFHTVKTASFFEACKTNNKMNVLLRLLRIVILPI